MASFLRRALAALLIVTAHTAAAQTDQVQVRWLGVAGFSIVGGATTLLVDPYFSRYSAWKLFIDADPYCPDAGELRSWLTSARVPELAAAKHVLIGHSHFDHLGDAPWIAGFNHATIYGSETTALIAEAYAHATEECAAALDEMQHLTTRVFGPMVQPTPMGEFLVRAIASCHAPVAPIVGVPFEGTYSMAQPPPPAPFKARKFLLGDTRAHVVEHPATGVTLLITSSGCLNEDIVAALAPQQPIDVVFAAAPEGNGEQYVQRITALRPAFVVPHHYESFFDRHCTDARHPRDLDRFKRALHEAGTTAWNTRPLERLCVSRMDGRTQLATCSGSRIASESFAQPPGGHC